MQVEGVNFVVLQTTSIVYSQEFKGRIRMVIARYFGMNLQSSIVGGGYRGALG